MPPIDLRASFPVALDQGRRGTCIAFAATAGHEFLRFRQTGEWEDLSEETLHCRCKLLDGDRDSGTSFQNANQVLGDFGQPPEAIWIYDKFRKDFRGDYVLPREVEDSNLCFRATFSSISSLPDVIAQNLEMRKPVIAGISLCESFLFAPSGRVSMPMTKEPMVGQHAVLIVGWQFDLQGAQWFIFRNSWGTRWGDQGYGYIKAEYLEIYGCATYVFDS